jgi:MoxR-like ATPase
MAARTKFAAIEAELNATFFERREVVRGLLVALLAKENICLIGAPGTAKSAIAEDLCSRFGGRYFRWLLARTTTPEELFGPVSVKALQNDSYRRVTTNKLPEADVATLDEIWKASPAILNSLLTGLNERLFFNDGQPTVMPLQMAIGASNEMPENLDELGALWDRFLLRYVVPYIKDPRNFEAMLLGSGKPQARTLLTREELAAAQAEVAQVTFKRLVPQITALRRKMAEMHVPVSDRRWKQCLKLIAAHAWLEGRADATDDDLVVLAHSLWQEPSQVQTVRTTILNLVNPLDQEAMALEDEALEIHTGAMASEDAQGSKVGTEANAKLKRIMKRLAELEADATKAGKSTERMTEAKAKVVAWNKEVLAKCLGLTI